MKELYKNLWVGSEEDVPKARSKGYAIVHACKDGEHSHRQLLGYGSMKAPKNSEYLTARRKDELYLNLIDGEDPSYVPDKLIDAALEFITEQLNEPRPVLIHCVEGRSRGPSLALIWLALNGKIHSLSQFKKLYPDYEPNVGMKLYTKARVTARR